tara:strand:+ start:5228 stop:6577 length:1350 start_codon:yes stop_codon:yes gene_type:complete
MKRLKLAMIALFAFVTVGNISAQDENNPWVIGAGVNSIDIYNGTGDFFSSEGQFKDMFDNHDWNILPAISRITAEKYLNKGFSLQLAATVNKIENLALEDGDDLLYLSADVIIKYDLNNIVGDTGWFDPYLLLGASTVTLGEEAEGMLNAGLGFNTWFNDRLGLNFQHSSKIGFATKISNHYQTSVGLVFKFGGKDTDGDEIYDKDDACPEVAGLKEFNGCPDTDGDGVKDSDDACPNTAGLAMMNGCPDSDGDGVADKDDMCASDKGTKANKGCPDSDGDGVIDKNDKCASVSGPAENGGCPWPDADGDGVLDKDDKCVNEVGSASDDGCPVKTIPLDTFSKTILFNTGKSSFKSGITSQLDGMMEIFKEFPTSQFAVRGYTDSTGGASRNLSLSDQRANAVRNYLIKNGIDASRLTAKGFGEVSPVAPNNTKAGRAENRRVEVKVTN